MARPINPLQRLNTKASERKPRGKLRGTKYIQGFMGGERIFQIPEPAVMEDLVEGIILYRFGTGVATTTEETFRKIVGGDLELMGYDENTRRYILDWYHREPAKEDQ